MLCSPVRAARTGELQVGYLTIPLELAADKLSARAAEARRQAIRMVIAPQSVPGTVFHALVSPRPRGTVRHVRFPLAVHGGRNIDSRDQRHIIYDLDDPAQPRGPEDCSSQ